MNVRRVVIGFLVLSLSFLSGLPAAVADRPAPPKRHVTVDQDGQHLFVMVPERYQESKSIPAFGVAYELTPEGSLEPTWRVDGWHATTVVMGGNGRLLVRYGPWASAPPEEELAIAFYVEGQEVKRHTVADLLDDVESVERSISHYVWEGPDRNFWRVTRDNHYQLTTIEGYLFRFNMETGEIVEKRKMED